MIGFRIYAYGSGGFVFQRSAWTEGSLLALDLALLVGHAPHHPFWKLKGLGELGGKAGFIISDHYATKGLGRSFRKIKEAGFTDICSYDWDFTLWVSGDFHFKYHFMPKKSSDRRLLELLITIQKQKNHMRDQVAIYFTQAIRQYHLFAFDRNPPFGMNMVINL